MCAVNALDSAKTHRVEIAIFTVALLVRLVVAASFVGSLDIPLQLDHARAILSGAPAWTSKLPLAHFLPPLMELLSRVTPISPAVAQKLPAIAGDLLTALLLLRIARRYQRSGPSWLWPAVYLLNPVTVMLSAYQGNCDPLMAGAMLWALDLRWREKPLAAGAALGLAIAMKPPAVLALPALLLPLRRRGNASLAAAAILVPALLCAPFAFFDPAFGRFLLSYGGAYGEWGIVLIARQLDQNVAGRMLSLPEWMAKAFHGLHEVLAVHGRYVMAAVLAAWFLYAMRRWKVMTFEENACVLAATLLVFFIIATGWGAQYLSLALPFLLIVSVRLTIVLVRRAHAVSDRLLSV